MPDDDLAEFHDAEAAAKEFGDFMVLRTTAENIGDEGIVATSLPGKVTFEPDGGVVLQLGGDIFLMRRSDLLGPLEAE